MKESILKNISQIILIVFSVVLGLYLSERIEDRKNEQEAAKLLSKIKAELRENKKLLDYWVPYHGEMVKHIDSLSNNELFIERFINDKSTLYEVFTRGTIMSESPSNEAWDIAKSHPLIVNFEYDELLVLSRIYRQQKTTYESLPKMIELLVAPDINARENAKLNLQLFKNRLEDITSREVTLVNYYNQGETILNFENQ